MYINTIQNIIIDKICIKIQKCKNEKQLFNSSLLQPEYVFAKLSTM